MVRDPPDYAGDTRDVGLIPGSERFPGGGNDSQCILARKTPRTRGSWQAAVRGAPKSQTRLSTHTHTSGRENLPGCIIIEGYFFKKEGINRS